MGRKVHQKIDLSDKRKVYAVGDIHGCFTDLEQALWNVRFDPNQDALISVGDLVDRGPESHLAIKYINKPWFYRCLGNHDMNTLEVYNGEAYYALWNQANWLETLSKEEQLKHVEILNDAPFLLEVSTPKGLKVGFVHASLHLNDWNENILYPDFDAFVYHRSMAKKLIDPSWEPNIKNIDKVFFGHTALTDAVKRGNCRWIDTGSGFIDGKLTIVDVDEF